jgi:cytochrome c oxidase subunit IV
MAHPTEAHADNHGHHEGDFAHPASIRMLLTIFVILVILTLLTVYQSTFEMGAMEIWLSLLIATVKASLVILFFMHLLWDKPFNAILFISSIIFVSLFLGFTLLDADAYSNKIELKDTLAESMKAAPESVEGTPTMPTGMGASR